eukprot:TRINITY_DN8667_c0_g1_i2.p1 TRINITY_DN8667_c0_g1~~TRINITY_DN8667_c0_g1_i2.p1  ORF type:complete len:876 (+),score=233.69 TRINITY_DN8667_c0_g1_i2:143-2770(+)
MAAKQPNSDEERERKRAKLRTVGSFDSDLYGEDGIEDIENNSGPDKGSPRVTPMDADDEPILPEVPELDAKQSFHGPDEPLVLDTASDGSTIQVPGSINRYLRDYQREGVVFMYKAYSRNGGCVLADDMGLGKTVQTIALLSAVLHKRGHELDAKYRALPSPGALLVVPSSLVSHWSREIRSWLHARIGIYHGSPTNKHAVLTAAKLGQMEVVITTYASLRTLTQPLTKIAWDLVVLDEVHKIKDAKTATAKACMALKCKRRIGLSGTLMSNRFEELHAIMDFVDAGCLGTLADFKRHYADPIKRGQGYNASAQELSACRARARELSSVLTDHVLRREKSRLSHELPEKQDKVVFCLLTPHQQKVYERALRSEEIELIRRKNEKCDCGSDKLRGDCCHKETAGGVPWRTLLLPALTKLQKIACHPIMLMPTLEDAAEKRSRDYKFAKAALSGMGIPREHDIVKLEDCTAEKLIELSGKLRALDALLEASHRRDDKVLLFSNSVRMLDILQQFVTARNYSWGRLDGTTPTALRQKLVDDFNTNPSRFLFLISTRVGGLGLNLSAANVCIVFDPNWNPSHDLQAQDRLFRIGQQRRVCVYRLIAAGTIEELVYNRQIYKQQLASVGMQGANERRYFAGVSGVKGQEGELFGVENLLKLVTDRLVTSDILQRQQQLGKAAAADRTGAAGDAVLEASIGLVVPNTLQYESQQHNADDDEAKATAAPSAAEGVVVDDDEDVYNLVTVAEEVSQAVVHPAVAVAPPPSVEATATHKTASSQDSQSVTKLLAHVGVVFTTTPGAMLGDNKVEKQLSDKASAAVAKQFAAAGGMRALTPKQRAFVHLADHLDVSMEDMIKRVLEASEADRDAMVARYRAETGM